MSGWVTVAPSTSVMDKSKNPQPRALQESVIVLGPLAGCVLCLVMHMEMMDVCTVTMSVPGRAEESVCVFLTKTVRGMLKRSSDHDGFSPAVIKSKEVLGLEFNW